MAAKIERRTLEAVALVAARWHYLSVDNFELFFWFSQMVRTVLLIAGLLAAAYAQSNYAERGLDVEYQGNGLPQEATLDGIVTRLDDLSHKISTNRYVQAITKRENSGNA